ncbi:MAG: hypothetical protein F9K13_08700 [Candidatus Methylomirabilis oxygeniifera]|nr:MAG: hypothetical protein F9K13_08700 [Candidatus Methylomirabilis oxyfera]
MKRLLTAGVMVGLLVSGTSISWAATNLNSSKSNINRVPGQAGDQVKGTTTAAAPATQDPCASVKNDPNQYAKCQDATKPAGLKHSPRRGGY